MDTKQSLLIHQTRIFIKSLLDRSEGNAIFDNEESLVISGRLSSLSLVELAAELEKKYNIDFADGFNQYDFDSINSIVNLIIERGNIS